jgi:hypothetical protein
MKRLFVCAVLLIATSVVGFAQTSTTQQAANAPVRKSPLADYIGSWIGMFDGHAWITVRLTLQGTTLSGTVQRAHEFQFADSGLLKSVSDDQITEGLESAALQGDGLLITVKDPGTQQTDRYVMRLTGANTADLKMVAMSMPPGMPKPQPWKLTKVTATAVAPAH